MRLGLFLVKFVQKRNLRNERIASNDCGRVLEKDEGKKNYKIMKKGRKKQEESNACARI